MTQVALVELGEDVTASFQHALKLIGGVSDIHNSNREVLYKLGVFEPKQQQYTTVPVAQAIVESFSQSPKIWLIESDNSRGTGTERLQIWRDLFSDRIVPYNLSEDSDTKTVNIAGDDMELSHLLFENRVLLNSHTLRRYDKGSVIKNLFGLPPMKNKDQYHKNLEAVILDLYEAVGGIDLAVLDGTYAYPGPAAGIKKRIPVNIVLVGRDAVAVDAVGAALMGMSPMKMPIIQEAMKRGFGEANLDKINIVGSDFGEIQEKIKSTSR